MNFKDIHLKYKAAKRFNDIVGILIRNGFDFVLNKIKISKLLFIKMRIPKVKRVDLPLPVAIRKTFEDVGATLIKFGQVLSTRADLLPAEYITELSRLQDCVTPEPFEKIKPLIEYQYRKIGFNNIFKYIDEEPIGSASLCQVYKAVLQSGEEVILKVKRPDIDGIIETDIEILKIFSNLIKNYLPELGIDFREIINNFELNILKELDLTNEANYILRFRKNFKNKSSIVIPEVYKDLSSENIIVMEYIDGIKLTDIESVKKQEIDLRKLLLNGAESIVKQIFRDGLFHADPHPGNIIIVEKTKLAFIDFGIIGHLSPEYRKYLFDMSIAAVEKDAAKIYYVLISMNAIDIETDSSGFKNDLYCILDEMISLPLNQIHIKQIFNKSLYLIKKYRISIPEDFLLLFRTLIILDGIGKNIFPDFNLLTELKPLLKQTFIKDYNLINLIRLIKNRTFDFIYFTKDLPYDLKRIIHKIINGNLKIEFEHVGLENLVKSINFSSTLLAIAIINGALMLSSTLILMIAYTKNLEFLIIPSISGFVLSGFLTILIFYKYLFKR